MVRITENNDWVVYCILASIFAYIILLSFFQREANIKDFLTQKTEDANNLSISWLIISLVRNAAAALLLSQFIPIVPKFISDIQLGGFQINKFGFMFFALVLYDSIKSLLTFLFYASVGSSKNLKNLTLLSNKYFFLESVVMLIAGFVLYYYPIDLVQYFYYIVLWLCFSFVLKNMIYLFHNRPVLPEKWYYKFLYICTLQIVPVLVLWKFLFF